MSEEMENLFWELKQVLVQHSPKWNTLCDIEQYIQDLQHQLEEKDKVINDIKENAEEIQEMCNEKIVHVILGDVTSVQSMYSKRTDLT